jgi:anti-sigma B factor antagonist
MTIQKTLAGTSLTVAPEGRLDTITSPQFESELRADMNAVTDLVFDLANLTYISSAGLRVLLSAQKAMNKKGTMVLRNVRPEIMEIFEITGFSSILTIE